MHYDFDKDLVDGLAGEQEIRWFLSRRFGGSLTYTNETKHLDTLMNFPAPTPFGVGHVSFEIKTDVLVSPERDTGNLFIEVQSRGKKSGIQVCQADWFLYYLKHFDEVWAIRPQDCLALIRTGGFRSIEGGDAGSGTRGVLMEKYRVEKNFLIFTGVTHEVERVV